MLFGTGAAQSPSEPPEPPTPPAERIRFTFPFVRQNIGQVWHDNMWVWAVVRAPSRGRPRKGMRGDWLSGTIFVPWAMRSGMGLGVPRRLPNSLDDALRAAAELAAKPRKRLSLAKQLGFRACRGRPRTWTAEEQARLLSLVVAQATADGEIPEKVFRSRDLRRAFGNRSSWALRRQFFIAWSAYNRELAADQIGEDFRA